MREFRYCNELIKPGMLSRVGTMTTPYLGSTQPTHPPEDLDLFHLVPLEFIASWLITIPSLVETGFI